MKSKLIYGALVATFLSVNIHATESIRVATFNVSMDATNYTAKGEPIKSDALVKALTSNTQQIKNIA